MHEQEAEHLKLDNREETIIYIVTEIRNLASRILLYALVKYTNIIVPCNRYISPSTKIQTVHLFEFLENYSTTF